MFETTTAPAQITDLQQGLLSGSFSCVEIFSWWISSISLIINIQEGFETFPDIWCLEGAALGNLETINCEGMCLVLEYFKLIPYFAVHSLPHMNIVISFPGHCGKVF